MPSSGETRPFTPSWAPERAGRVAARLQDARFDFDLRLRLVEIRDELPDLGERSWQILHDEHVGSLVDLGGAARGEHACLFQQLLQRRGRRVVELQPDGLQSWRRLARLFLLGLVLQLAAARLAS